jgi:hypothetical protein
MPNVINTCSQNVPSICPGGHVVGTSIILNNILNVPKKIEEHAENIQTKCMCPQYTHWAYAGNIL